MTKSKKKGPLPQKKTASSPDNKTTWLILAGILGITFIAYLSTLNNGLIFWDDPEYITNNPYTKAFDLKEIFSAYYMGNYHPLTLVSYAIEYKLFGMSTFMFHLDNILIHLANTFLVFLFVHRLFDKKKIAIAAVTALLFGIHPMHVESVTWVSERKDTLHALFYFLALLSYLSFVQKGRKPVWLILTFIYSVLSLLSKGQAVSLPLIFILIDYFNYKTQDTRRKTQDLLLKIPFLILAAVFGYVAILAQRAEIAINASVSLDFKNISYGFYALFTYIYKLFIPINLAGLHPYPKYADQSLPGYVYIGFLTIPIILFVLYKTYKTRKEIFFGLLFFLFAIAPMLKFIPVGDTIIAERYTYIPYVGLFIIAGYFFDFAVTRWKNYQRIFQAAGAAVVLAFCFITYSHAQVYKNSYTFWQNVIDQYPDYWRGNHCLGKTYYDDKNYDKAMEYFNRAIERDKWERPIPYLWRGATLLDQFKQPEEAIKDFRRVIAMTDPNDQMYKEGMMNLGLSYFRMGKHDSALILYRQLLPTSPGEPKLYNNMGLALAASGKQQEALEAYSKSIELNPSFTDPILSRGVVYTDQLGEYDKGIADFKKVLQLDPANEDAAINIGISLYKKGETDAAISQYNSVISANPNIARVYYLRALAYSVKKDSRRVQEDVQQARSLGMAIDENAIQ